MNMLTMMNSLCRVDYDIFRRCGYVNENDLIKTIFIIISAVIANANSPEEIEDFAYSRKNWIKKHVYADYKSLDKDLIVALLTMLRHESLSDMLSNWLRRLGCCCSENGALVCEEAVEKSFCQATGFSCCNSVCISAFDASIVLERSRDQWRKDDEISFLENIVSLLDVKNNIVSVDSNFSSPCIASRIVDNSGDYLVSVFPEKSKFYDDLVTIFNYGMTAHNIFDHSFSFNVDDFCNAMTFDVINDMFWVQESNAYKDAKSVIRTVLLRTEHNRRRVHSRYYVSSVEFTDEQNDFFRKQFWRPRGDRICTVDIAGRRDAADDRDGRARENLALLRNAALGFLENAVPARQSFDSLRKKAAWDSEFLASVLSGRCGRL